MSPALKRAAIYACLGWLAVFAVVSLYRPLMPVDETRYLSVAWEMLVQQHWILPTLNFEPYSHKPPMLFWLVRLAWLPFGTEVWPVRVLIFIVVAILGLLTVRLAQRLDAGRETPAFTLMALGAMPALLVYSSVIMFDALIATWVVGFMLIVWRLGQSDQWRWWLAAGVVLGGGILAKGPVACVYMLPVALLAPVWTRAPSWRHWYAGVFTALVIGAGIGLAWAMPAALQGGADYAHRIFVKQSAGRMMDAFDHREPFWFYLPVVMLFTAPLLAWPGLWRSMAAGRQERVSGPVRFILCWVGPAFLFFSAISSKQVHYMLPLMPGLAVLAGMALSRAGMPGYRTLLLPLGLLLVPSLVVMVYEAFKMPLFNIKMDEAAEHLGYLHIALSLGLAWWARRKPENVMPALMLASFLLAAIIHLQLGQRYLPRYDLSDISQAVLAHQHRPMAATPKYDGEYGYVFRTHKHITSIGREEVADWLKANPTGLVIARYKTAQVPSEYRVIFRQRFRNDEELVLMEKRS